jgi:hypothetical protein
MAASDLRGLMKAKFSNEVNLPSGDSDISPQNGRRLVSASMFGQPDFGGGASSASSIWSDQAELLDRPLSSGPVEDEHQPTDRDEIFASVRAGDVARQVHPVILCAIISAGLFGVPNDHDPGGAHGFSSDARLFGSLAIATISCNLRVCVALCGSASVQFGHGIPARIRNSSRNRTHAPQQMIHSIFLHERASSMDGSA